MLTRTDMHDVMQLCGTELDNVTLHVTLQSRMTACHIAVLPNIAVILSCVACEPVVG
jgi:hypothetical protein